MLKRVLGVVWRGIKSIFTLKGGLVTLLLVALSTGMLMLQTKKMSDPRFVPIAETTGTAGTDASATPRMAIVIVGLGGEGRGLDALISRLMALNVPLTCGVMPGTATTKRHAQLVGPIAEIDLQLPVAFSRGRNPNSPGEVKPTMRRRQMARQVVSDIFSVGRVAGIAARGGYIRSKTDPGMMRIIMTMAKRRNLYFLDLTGNRAAADIASSINVTYVKPDVVLDDVATADAVRRKISVAINKAVSTKGNVVVLGHLLPVTVNTLEELIPKIKAARIEFTTVSGLNVSTEPTATPSLLPTQTPEPSGTLTPMPTPAPTTAPSSPGGTPTP